MRLIDQTPGYINTRFPSGECLGKWRKDTSLSLREAMTICLYTQKKTGKNNEFAFSPQYFLGVLDSRIFSTFWVLDIDVPTTDLLLRKYAQHTKLLHRMIRMISRRASHFELQLKGRQEATRGGARAAWDAAYCRILCKEHVLRTTEQEDNT